MPSIQIKKVRFYNLKLVQTKFMCKYPCTGLKKKYKKFYSNVTSFCRKFEENPTKTIKCTKEEHGAQHAQRNRLCICSHSVFGLPLKNLKCFLESHRMIIKYLAPDNI